VIISDVVLASTTHIKSLKFKMAAFNKFANSINTALNGFLDHENMGIETKMKYLCASHTEITGGHFKIQDGCLYQVIQY
jgi:hypothetical protein